MTEAEISAVVESLRIGEIAGLAGVSTRTVRYYEQVGLIDTVSRSAGGTRRYCRRDVEVLVRIRELQSVMGFDLDQIRTILAAEKRLDELRSEWPEASETRSESILNEASAINHDLRAQVEAKIATLQGFLTDLEAKADRHRTIAAELGLELRPTRAPVTT